MSGLGPGKYDDLATLARAVLAEAGTEAPQ